jgi:hypothetical protein
MAVTVAPNGGQGILLTYDDELGGDRTRGASFTSASGIMLKRMILTGNGTSDSLFGLDDAGSEYFPRESRCPLWRLAR